MNKILSLAKKYEKEIIEHRRHFHRFPEVGFDLPRTQNYVIQKLKEMGIEGKPCGKIEQEVIDKFKKVGFPWVDEVTGVVAVIGKGSPCILLRADMDALPMQENTGLEFESEEKGKMHACGHDAHTAMLLGAARLLKEKESELKGSVKLMFQTGEELGFGSRLMIDDGLMENPEVHAALAIHIMPDVLAGNVHYPKNVASSSMDTWMLKIQGKGGHSSMPHQTVDPVMIMTQLYTQLNLLVTREAPPSATVAMTIGKAAGGTASNIIPDSSELQIGLRTYDPAVRDHLEFRFNEMIDHMVTAWRGTYSFEKFFTPSTVSDEAFVEEMIPNIQEIVGEEAIKEVPPMGGAEDFGYVTSLVPGMFIMLGVGGEDALPLHNPQMIIDEDQLKIGSAIYANCALAYLESRSK